MFTFKSQPGLLALVWMLMGGMSGVAHAECRLPQWPVPPECCGIFPHLCREAAPEDEPSVLDQLSEMFLEVPAPGGVTQEDRQVDIDPLFSIEEESK